MSVDDYHRSEYNKRILVWQSLSGDVIVSPPLLPTQLKLPTNLLESLFDYQLEGIQWLYSRLILEKKGGLLADDMGLGKTIQVIGFLAALDCTADSLSIPSLIVVPATTLSQWVEECHRWYFPLRVIVLHESFHSQPISDLLLKVDRAVYLVTYDGLQSHADALLEKEWNVVVLDEAHEIKNRQLKVTELCKKIKTTRRIALTGTPLQNDMGEFWSVMDFVCPGILDTYRIFQQEYMVPIQQGREKDASPFQIFFGFWATRNIKRITHPYLLQRFKKDTLVHLLPPKHEYILWCELGREQYPLYVQELILARNTKKWTVGLFWKQLVRLRNICNHPNMLEEKGMDPSQSSKVMVLLPLLREWRQQGHKVLMFSQRLAILHMWKQVCKEENWSYKMMEGSTPISMRHTLLTEFNQDDTFMFLLTTKVGGVGVNLTGASKVILFDPDWNPAVDQQAKERAWRLGQTKAVDIYRVITRGTIEEKMLARQEYKTWLAKHVLEKGPQDRLEDKQKLMDLFIEPPPSRSSTCTYELEEFVE